MQHFFSFSISVARKLGGSEIFFYHGFADLLRHVLCYIAFCYFKQRWSPRGRPRGHILKSLALALASKVKSLALALASKPQVLENCPVLGSRTALFFEQLKFRWKTPETSQKICEHLFCFPRLEHRRSQGEGDRESAPSPIEISPMTKM